MTREHSERIRKRLIQYTEECLEYPDCKAVLILVSMTRVLDLIEEVVGEEVNVAVQVERNESVMRGCVR